MQAVRARSQDFPICAIAGINNGNAAEVIAAGADGVAVISALSLAPDPSKAAEDLRAVVDSALEKRGGCMTAIAVTIAGSDSSGGAGIQADLKTFAALGVYGASVITALTAQNTQGVTAIHDVPPGFIAAQIDAVFSDLDVAAVKIGMLSRTPAIEAVARGLMRHKAKNIVLDPVMVATSGAALIAPDAVGALRRLLIPRALIVTPNLAEAAALTGASLARNEQEMEMQAREILSLGARRVLIKGGHGDGAESVDLLIGEGDVVRLSAKRIATNNTHGTGCTLSSAIAAGLAKGADIATAVHDAKAYVTAAIAAADQLKRQSGHGHGPTEPFLCAEWRTQMTTRRKFTIGAGAAAAGVLAAPEVARAQNVKWKMVTSWPRRLPGPGMSAERIADRIRTLSGGRSTSPSMPPAKWCRPSAYWRRSATASPISATPRRSTGRAKCRRRRFSPRCRSD